MSSCSLSLFIVSSSYVVLQLQSCIVSSSIGHHRMLFSNYHHVVYHHRLCHHHMFLTVITCCSLISFFHYQLLAQLGKMGLLLWEARCCRLARWLWQISCLLSQETLKVCFIFQFVDCICRHIIIMYDEWNITLWRSVSYLDMVVVCSCYFEPWNGANARLRASMCVKLCWGETSCLRAPFFIG